MDELFPESVPARETVLSAPTEENLRAFFKARIAEWPHTTISGECFTAGTFGDFTAKLGPATAFALIPASLRILKEFDGTEGAVVALSLLYSLAVATDTTELHHDLASQWTALEGLLERNGLADSVYWDGLKSWYRRRPNRVSGSL